MPLIAWAAFLAAGKEQKGVLLVSASGTRKRVARFYAIVAGRLLLGTICCLFEPDRETPGSASMPRANANSCHGALRLTRVYPLREQNTDFSQFIQNVKIDFQSKKIHTSEYDELEDDIETYLKQLLK